MLVGPEQTSQTDASGSYGTDTEIWLGIVNSAGASTSISIALSSSTGTTYSVADICEYSGIATSSYLDKTAVNTVFPAQVLALGQLANNSKFRVMDRGNNSRSAAAQTSPTNGFTDLDGATYTSTSVAYLQNIVYTTGTANSGTAISSNRFAGCIATFKAAYNVQSTTTTLSGISTPLTPGENGVSFSGSVSSSGTAVPSGSTGCFAV